MNSSVRLFIHIAVFIALGFFLGSGLLTLYSVIDILIFPESLNWFDYRSQVSDQLPTSTAFVIISSICLFILSVRASSFPESSDEEKWQEIANRFILMGSLIGSALLTLIPIGIILAGLLQGDTSLNLLTRLLATTLIGIVTFLYYRGVLRNTWNKRKTILKAFGVTFVLLTGALVAAAIIIIDPLTVADKEEAYNTLDALRNTHQEVINLYIENDELPETLPEDPFFNRNEAEIKYTKTGEEEFELCAELIALPEYTNLEDYPYSAYPVTTIGESCFTLPADASSAPFPFRIPPTPRGT